jgi:HSP20 family protein
MANKTEQNKPQGQGAEPRPQALSHKGEQQGVSRHTQSGAQWSPFSFMRRFSEEMDRLFEDFGFGGSLSPTRSFSGGALPSEFGRPAWRPQIEMFQRGEELVVRADLPGMTKDDVKIECTANEITIQGERKEEREEAHEGIFHSERTYGRFFRQIPLPEGVSADDAKATFRDGVLEITMKAPDESKQRRRIQIEA